MIPGSFLPRVFAGPVRFGLVRLISFFAEYSLFSQKNRIFCEKNDFFSDFLWL